jgi:phospholipid/cholesterol/gamma-HCH transport system substrate-binding protein
VRRLAAISAALAAIVITLALTALGGAASASSSGTFDVIFDDARGLIAGQLVKVAGANAGTITHVSVTSNFKARIQASIDSRFLPFHTDATCEIRPEGLIAENYIDCDPGTLGSPVLTSQNGLPPTVPVQNTQEPVSLMDLFNVFNVPARERFALIIDELGIGTAGEGENFNAIIRRANPALAYARDAIRVLDSQQAQLKTILSATNVIAAQAAAHTGDLQRFLDQAAQASATTADHSGALAAAVQRLPGLLAAAEPALKQLNTVAIDGTPLVNEIHTAIPALNTLSQRLGPFVKIAKPALAKLAVTFTKAVPAVRETTPVFETIKHYLKLSLPSTIQIAKVFENLQQHGFTENFLANLYYLAALTARYDSVGHLAVAYLIDPQDGACGAYASKPVPGCSANYGNQSAYTPSRRQRRHHARRGTTSTTTTVTTTTTTGSPPSSGASTTTPTTTTPGSGATGTTGTSTTQASQALQNLVNYLLK